MTCLPKSKAGCSESFNPEYVLILSGDDIYKMDYEAMLDFHKENNAEVTIAVMPVPMEEELLKGKSIILYFPPKATAGFATFDVRTPNRLPCPPAKSMELLYAYSGYVNVWKRQIVPNQ